MYLTQILWESDGLRAKEEYACIATGCPGQYTTGIGYPGKNYYGRGYIQLVILIYFFIYQLENIFNQFEISSPGITIIELQVLIYTVMIDFLEIQN